MCAGLAQPRSTFAADLVERLGRPRDACTITPCSLQLTRASAASSKSRLSTTTRDVASINSAWKRLLGVERFGLVLDKPDRLRKARRPLHVSAAQAPTIRSGEPYFPAATPSAAPRSLPRQGRGRVGDRRRHRRRPHLRARQGAGAADRPAQCAVRCDLHAHGGARLVGPADGPDRSRADRDRVGRSRPALRPPAHAGMGGEPVRGATVLPDAPAVTHLGESDSFSLELIRKGSSLPS